MKTLWLLLKKDLLRDSRHPWGIVVLMTVPVLTAVIISLVFSPQNDIRKNVKIEVAILDRDDDFFSGMLRAISNQGPSGENLKLHFVDTEAAGLRLVERRQVSALVVLPENLTVDVLDGRATALTLYKSPAEAVLPQIVEEALRIACIGASQALRLLQPEVQKIRTLVDRDTMPEAVEVAAIAADSVNRLKTVEPYLFPPLIQFQTVAAADYRAQPQTPSPDANEVQAL